MGKLHWQMIMFVSSNFDRKLQPSKYFSLIVLQAPGHLSCVPSKLKQRQKLFCQYCGIECSSDYPPDDFPGCFVWSRDGVHPAGGAQLEAAGGGTAAAAREGSLHAGL